MKDLDSIVIQPILGRLNAREEKFFNDTYVAPERAAYNFIEELGWLDLSDQQFAELRLSHAQVLYVSRYRHNGKVSSTRVLLSQDRSRSAEDFRKAVSAWAEVNKVA